MTNKFVPLLSSKCKKLKKLILADCKNVSEEGIESVLKSFKNLEMLDVSLLNISQNIEASQRRKENLLTLQDKFSSTKIVF